MYIFRDFSYSEKDDYRIHILPLLNVGSSGRPGKAARVDGIFEQRQTGAFLTGWHVIEGANMNDTSHPGQNSQLDPSRGFHAW